MSKQESDDLDAEEEDKEFLRREEQKKQRRTDQLEQIEKVIQPLQAQVKALIEQSRHASLLDSVSAGLYDELDKLAKKAPADTITDLALEKVNDLIRETKGLAATDAYVQKQNEFVAAGDNPEYRDVVMVLRQARQGLARFSAETSTETKRVTQLLSNARATQVALSLFLNGKAYPSRGDIQFNGEDASPEWFESGGGFMFYKLDRTNIPEYFAAIL